MQHDISQEELETASHRPCEEKGNYFYSNCPRTTTGEGPGTLTRWVSGSGTSAGRSTHKNFRRMSKGTKVKLEVRARERMHKKPHTPRLPYPLKEEQPKRDSYKSLSLHPTALGLFITLI